MISIKNQIKFYKEELEELNLEVKSNFESTAKSLFATGKIYLGEYKGFDRKRGNLFFDIKNEEGYHSPRIDQLMNCFKLIQGRIIPPQWKTLTYKQLIGSPLNSELDMTECKLVAYMKSERKGWITMLVGGADLNFINSINVGESFGFGPTIPPYEYLQNLLNFTTRISTGKIENNQLLNFFNNYDPNRSPILINEKVDIPKVLLNKANEDSLVIFQGPPGTGKTHQISDLVSRLAKMNKSVIVTALTNKAAIEVCEKPFLDDLLNEGLVSKTNLLSNEKSKFPNLEYEKKITPKKGHIILSTYYQFSKTWETYNKDFDYVIVEEASQAFLTTIAAATKIGKHVIVVGDPYQIQPIVKYNNYKNISPEIDKLVYGLETVCKTDGLSLYRKVETRRLTTRATKYTNYFYNDTIESKSIVEDLIEDKKKLPFLSQFIHKEGGPTLILKKLEKGNQLNSILPFLEKAINDITDNKRGSIAILTPFIDTLIFLQKNLKIRTKSNKYLIDTVDRVQGLDVDYCFYVLPRRSYGFSFKLNRFNVATSRSKKATFILADHNFHRETVLSGNSGRFINNLMNDFCFVENNGIYEKVINSTSTIAKANSLELDNYEEIYQYLLNNNLITEDGNYNSYLDQNNKVEAEADFVFSKNSKWYAVSPFSDEDSNYLNKVGVVVLSQEEFTLKFIDK